MKVQAFVRSLYNEKVEPLITNKTDYVVLSEQRISVEECRERSSQLWQKWL